MPNSRPTLTRQELLGGFRGGDRRRAAIAMALIEGRAARFAIERGTVSAPFMTERYRFTRRVVPRIVAALGLDEPAVCDAYLRATGKPLETVFRRRATPAERLRWGWSGLSDRIESLPPFWTAFALTITETVDAGTLALPIALATVGPIGGATLLLLIGLVNLLTVAYLAEASARNGSIRHGSAFVGRLVHDYLGAGASRLLRVALFAFCCIVLASYCTGFASTLRAVTGLPAPLWVTVVCATGLFLILRRSLVGTLVSALLIGAINISVLVSLSVIALMHATRENLLYAELPFLDGRGFEPSHLQLVFGVVMVSYFGHLSVSNCAQAVLRRDPGGRSLKRGTIAAMAVAIGIYCLWTVSVGGAVGSEALRGETGTALVPLAAQIGPEIYVLGVLFAVLGLGMSSVHYGLGIVNMARELADRLEPDRKDSWARRHAASIVTLLPVIGVFGYVQWTYLNGTPSFSAPLELLGVLLTPVLAGIFPVLVLLASRAQGSAVRGVRLPKAFSNRAVLLVVMLLSFAGLLVHGLVIWEDPPRRTAALLTAAVMLWLFVDLLRRGAFTPSLHLEFRHFPEHGDAAEVAVAFGGTPADRSVRLVHAHGSRSALRPDGVVRDFRALRSIALELSGTRASKLVITALTVSRDHDAQPLAGQLVLHFSDGRTSTIELDTVHGLTKTNLSANALRAELSFVSG